MTLVCRTAGRPERLRADLGLHGYPHASFVRAVDCHKTVMKHTPDFMAPLHKPPRQALHWESGARTPVTGTPCAAACQLGSVDELTSFSEGVGALPVANQGGVADQPACFGQRMHYITGGFEDPERCRVRCKVHPHLVGGRRRSGCDGTPEAHLDAAVHLSTNHPFYIGVL